LGNQNSRQMVQLEFNINYRTIFGENLFIDIDFWDEAGNSFRQNHPLYYTGNGEWSTTIALEDKIYSLSYRYTIVQNSATTHREWGGPHLLTTNDINNYYRICDRWQNQPADLPFLSSAFTKALFARNEKGKPSAKRFKQSITFRVDAPTVAPEFALVLLGSDPVLGNWNPAKAVKLNCFDFPSWEITLNSANIQPDVEFKFALTDVKTSQIIAWEPGLNRRFFVREVYGRESIVVNCQPFESPLPKWKGAGVAIPVFSLRTYESFGIGDFNDLHKAIDWAAATGQKVIQILPINDTTMNHTWQDSYPYNANSIFALHPVYLNPYRIGSLKNAKDRNRFELLREKLNMLKEIDYEKVTEVKWNYFRLIFEQEKETTLHSDGFLSFFEANKQWLIAYSAFSYLRDKYKTPDFTLWQSHQVYNSKEIERLCATDSPAYPDISLYYFLQYHLHVQLLDAVRYAHSKRIILKGDIPIGISPTSVEAWTEPHYFNLNGQAGAPPDDFSVNGQNWGFPTYNWENMEKDNYSWWKRRFTKMADYFDAYRIDHVLGFFRIWEIPQHAVHGLLGHFSPAMPYTVEEINGYGFYLDENHLAPHIHQDYLHELFGDYAIEASSLYLLRRNACEYVLKPEYDTQKKVQACFSGKTDLKSISLRDALYALISEVLFLEDPREKGKYHPRISAQFTFKYRQLSDSQKHIFNRLYDDFFYHRHNDYWYNQAMKKLPVLLSATSMLVCAEDLGMIPACVPKVMEELQMLSLEIQRMPKDTHVEFAQTDCYPYLSVATTSTHDMTTLRGWWEEDMEKRERYYYRVLHGHGHCPVFAEPHLCEQIVQNHLHSPSMLVILPLQDWLSVDGHVRRQETDEERINIPANPRHYWRYRMHIYLEDLLANHSLNHRIHTIIKDSSR